MVSLLIQYIDIDIYIDPVIDRSLHTVGDLLVLPVMISVTSSKLKGSCKATELLLTVQQRMSVKSGFVTDHEIP